jgi:hypothetical protein
MTKQKLAKIFRKMADELEKHGGDTTLFALTVSPDLAKAITKYMPGILYLTPTVMLWPDPTGTDRWHHGVRINPKLPKQTFVWKKIES